MSVTNILAFTRRHRRSPLSMGRRPPGGRAAAESGGVPTIIPQVGDVVGVGRLLHVWDDRRRWAGPAPGVDGYTWDDFGRAELSQAFHAVRRSVLKSAYVPHPERPVDIPRPGRTPRRLDIGTVVDRTVAASLSGLMAPLVAEATGPWAFAYKEGTSHLDMLAVLAVTAKREDRWVLGNHDVRQAFPSVPLGVVMDAHRELLERRRERADGIQPGHGGRREERAHRDVHARLDGDEMLLGLIAAVLGGTRGADARGLSQGNPFSPVAMELFMDRVLDAPVRRDFTDTPGLRYSDNLATLSRSVPEVRSDRDRRQRLLARHGLALKDEPNSDEKTVADLSAGETSQLLGFVIGAQDGDMTFRVGTDSWKKLESSLLECLNHPDPARAAKAVLLGWVGALGPAFEERQQFDLLDRVLSTARSMEFREIGPKSILKSWKNARSRWEQLLHDAGESSGGSTGEVGRLPPPVRGFQT